MLEKLNIQGETKMLSKSHSNNQKPNKNLNKIDKGKR